MYIRETRIDKTQLLNYAYEDLSVNYFILLGLSISKMIYKEVYYFYNAKDASQSPQVILLKRQSNNLQLICRQKTYDEEITKDIRHVLSNLPFKELISSQKNVNALGIDDLFCHKKNGAYIACAKKVKTINTQPFNLKIVTQKDITKIEALYKKVFDSFTPPKVMSDKLKNKRGRGIALYDHENLIAVAQTDFESHKEAIIVGVATDPDFQHKGYGYTVMSALCESLLSEGKTLYLHYDNPLAGRLYEKMGFIIVDQIGHYQQTTTSTLK